MAAKKTQDIARWNDKGQGMDYKIWSRTARRARLAPVLTLAACALILLGIAALERFHAYQFEQTMRLVRDFEQTRAGLLSGFQHLNAGTDSTSTAALEMDRDALLHDLQRLQKNAVTIGADVPSELSELAAALSTRLVAAAHPEIQASDRPGLQQAFAALDAEMLRLQASSAERLDGLLQRQQIQYSIGWLLALVTMGLLGFGVANNNRELRAAQAALGESEAQFQRLLNMLPQLVWICDANARIEYFNQRWVEYSGVPMQQLLEKGWGDLMHPDDVPAVQTQWAVVARSGTDALPEFRMRRHDGVYRWFSAQFGVSRNEQGQPVRWFGSSIDIDDVRSARAARERSERFLRDTLTALNEAVITFDATGRVTGCNPSAERVLGLPESVIMGRSPRLWDLSIQHEDGSNMPWDSTPAAMVLSSGVPCRDVLMQVVRSGGELCWLLVSAEPVYNSEKAVTAVVTSFRDVTERKQAQLELQRHQEQLEVAVAQRTRELTAEVGARRQAEQSMQTLNLQMQESVRFNRLVADNVPGRIAYWDRDVRCQFINKTYCEWFDSTPEEIMGRTMRETRGEAYFESLEPHISAALRGEAQDFERIEYSGQGKLLVSRALYVPDFRDGAVQGFFVLAIDITRQKEAELLLQKTNVELAEARDRATTANQAKSAFLANMSHEIRTPMNAIIGFTYMLRREIHDPAQQQRLMKIGTAANHLLEVINDILDLSKIEAGKLVLEGVDFSLDTLLTRTCSMVVDMARDKGLELVVNIAPLPDRLHGDPTRLMQALLNLLSNAVKFTESGSVSLNVSLLEQSSAALLIRFEVIDTGLGIEPADLARLFNPFAQADSTSTRLYVGTSLGLAITRHIAERMGGSIGGESELGQGSRFWFTVCLPSAAQQAAVQAPVLQGLRALVADDLLQARSALSAMLLGLGLRVDSVSNGREALEWGERAAAQDDPYDLALLDWAMPGLDGLETGLRLSDSLAQHHAMVLVSTRDSGAVHQLARDAGFASVLMKPVTPSMLVDCLMRVLKNSATSYALSDPSAPVNYILPNGQLGANILVVEDNPVNQEVATQLLSSMGLQVDVAGDGQQAVNKVRSRPYDLILMDVQMPRMDGLQATRLLRQDPLLAQLPIVAMTANALPEDRQACMDAGMNDHLSKPVDPRLLYAMLARWLPQQETVAVSLPEPPVLSRSPEQRLAELAPLLDLAQALEYCAGQANILVGVMTKFTAHYDGGGAKLMGYLRAGDLDAAARLLHSLRGVSATVGATHIMHLTKHIEQAMKEGESQAALVSMAEPLCTTLDTLVTEITARLQPPPSPPVQSGSQNHK